MFILYRQEMREGTMYDVLTDVVTDVDIIKLCENREACISKLFSEVSEYKSLGDYPFDTLEKIEQALSERGYVKVHKQYITNYHYKIKEI